MDEETVLDRPVTPADHRLVYGDDSSQFGDLRLPGGRGPFPVAVLVHGGFWRSSQTLTYLGHLAAALPLTGVATWNIEYRRVGSTGGGWPATLLDVAAAVDHLRSIVEPFHLDAGRVITLGHSAGGHLALWLSMRHRIAPASVLHSGTPLVLRGAICVGGVPDLIAAFEQRLGNDAALELVGARPDQEPTRYAARLTPSPPTRASPAGAGAWGS